MTTSHHGSSKPPGIDLAPRSTFFEGRFGRMFRNVPSFEPKESFIRELAERMKEANAPDGGGDAASPLDNPDIPAGYTYLGQFLDHDITFDPTSSLQRQNDPDALHNFRTPRLDLDSLYGRGPEDNPFMYDSLDPAKLLIGNNPASGNDGNALEPRDLPRNHQHRALIGDKRNDENTIISQLQLTFLDFHNQVVDDIRSGDFNEHLWNTGSDFHEAQRIAQWHYQWVIVHDFLPRVCGADTVDRLLTHKDMPDGGPASLQFRPEPKFYRYRVQPFMPVEFSVGAYRYGHSQIRPEYDLNNFVQDIPIFTSEPHPAPTSHLGGFRALPAQWTIDWKHFFKIDGSDGPPEPSRLIDTKLSGPMTELPANIAPDGKPGKSLAWFNLERGRRLNLPSGQAVARAMGLQPLSQHDLDIEGEAPLWYYVLREAEVQTNGHHLGRVGGRIVAEVILGLIDADPQSFMSVEPAWQPFLPSAEQGSFSMPDLIKRALLQR